MHDPYLLAALVISPTEHIKIALDAKPTLLVVVSNVQSGVEQAAVLVLRRRGETASLVNVVPVLPGLEMDVKQQRHQANILELAGPGAPEPRDELCLTLKCGLQSAKVSTEDAQGLRDMLSVLRALLEVAEANKFSLTSSHSWLAAYTDDAPLLDTEMAAPVFSRFTNSAILAERARPPSPKQGEVRISVGTFNVNGQWPAEDEQGVLAMKRWVRAEQDPEVLALGFQELDNSGQAYLYHNPAREQAWTNAAVRALGRRAAEYTKVASKQLVGLLILVFARVEVHDVATASVGVGLGGFVANKGAVAVRLRIGSRTLALVNMHLSAMEGLQAMERRCWDWNEIYKRLRFLLPADPIPSATDEAVELATTEHTISEHDVILNFGDLNFRLDLSNSEARRLVSTRQHALLLRYDQLNSLRTSGSLFHDFDEGRIAFAPTYKFDLGTDEYDSSEKQRVPSYTDRVLFCGEGVGLQEYESVTEVRVSDHKPVRATFVMQCE